MRADNIDCYYGDHDFGNNGNCKWCGRFNGAILGYQRYARALREGRACIDHFHRTYAAKLICKKVGKWPV